MSWDPKTALILYQPIDFYAIASKEVSKSVDSTKLSLAKLESAILGYELERRPIGCVHVRKQSIKKMSGFTTKVETYCYRSTAGKIDHLTSKKLAILSLKIDLEKSTQGFERMFSEKIASAEQTMQKLLAICEFYETRHAELVRFQEKP